jgi:hypothetical protein
MRNSRWVGDVRCLLTQSSPLNTLLYAKETSTYLGRCQNCEGRHAGGRAGGHAGVPLFQRPGCPRGQATSTSAFADGTVASFILKAVLAALDLSTLPGSVLEVGWANKFAQATNSF